MKILIIEDEELFRENLVELLTVENFDVITANNGRVGLDLAIRELPNLILCDLMIPEVDGYSVLNQIREEPITTTIPFIFITARATRNDFRQGMDLGADDYLTKPFTRAELLSAIYSRLHRRDTLAQHLTSNSDERKVKDIFH